MPTMPTRLFVLRLCARSLWLTGQPDLDLISPLSPGVQTGANVLFWSFIITSYFVLLNLLIAIFNTTCDRCGARTRDQQALAGAGRR